MNNILKVAVLQAQKVEKIWGFEVSTQVRRKAEFQLLIRDISSLKRLAFNLALQLALAPFTLLP